MILDLLLIGFFNHILLGAAIAVTLLLIPLFSRIRWGILGFAPLLLIQTAIPLLSRYTLDFDPYPLPSSQDLIDPQVFGILHWIWAVLALATVLLCAANRLRSTKPFSTKQSVAIIAIVFIELLTGIAILAHFQGSEYTRVLTSAESADGIYRVKLVQGVNWEGDDATFVYRSGNAYYRRLCEIGGDLVEIQSATIEFRSPSVVRLWATMAQRVANPPPPQKTLCGEWDLSGIPPREITTIQPSP